MLLYGALIVFFAFFYTAVVFNPKDTAEQLKKHGGFIPGIRPGQRTAEYIDYVLTRITAIGAIYLVVVCLLPEALITQAGVMAPATASLLVAAVAISMLFTPLLLLLALLLLRAVPHVLLIDQTVDSLE